MLIIPFENEFMTLSILGKLEQFPTEKVAVLIAEDSNLYIRQYIEAFKKRFKKKFQLVGKVPCELSGSKTNFVVKPKDISANLLTEEIKIQYWDKISNEKMKLYKITGNISFVPDYSISKNNVVVSGKAQKAIIGEK